MLNIFNKRFINDQKFEQIKSTQIANIPFLLEALVKHGINEKSSYSLRFYFYTNSDKKAKGLVAELGKLKYQLDTLSKNSRGEISVKGLSTPVEISKSVLEDWVKQMLNTGYKHDCEFDGFEVAVQ